MYRKLMEMYLKRSCKLMFKLTFTFKILKLSITINYKKKLLVMVSYYTPKSKHKKKN